MDARGDFGYFQGLAHEKHVCPVVLDEHDAKAFLGGIAITAA
jgi:hypothetical protein